MYNHVMMHQSDAYATFQMTAHLPGLGIPGYVSVSILVSSLQLSMLDDQCSLANENDYC